MVKGKGCFLQQQHNTHTNREQAKEEEKVVLHLKCNFLFIMRFVDLS